MSKTTKTTAFLFELVTVAVIAIIMFGWLVLDTTALDRWFSSL